MGLKPGWILGPRADAAVFAGPVAFGLATVAVASALGVPADALPPWAFLLFIVCIDVGHVWSTAFRVYLDPAELRRRPGLYLGTPLVLFTAGVLLFAAGAAHFWRVLAYLAVWHFVRQQWGWVAYARHAAGEKGALDRRLDQAAVYAATLYPLLRWHTHLPQSFVWFLEGDFVALPGALDAAGHALHWLVLGAFAARQVQRARAGLGVNWAKVQVVATTWVAWYVSIVVLASDLAFTALNVLSHGVPYLAVVWRIERLRWEGERGPLAALFRRGMAGAFVALLVTAGYAEEWVWDRFVWHDHPELFPSAGWVLGPGLLAVLVPLLVLPQATHYVLDGFLWRRRGNPDVRRLLR
ncbi:MAG: hypothetical protein AAF682_30660 [Planctomycetota bacterium]